MGQISYADMWLLAFTDKKTGLFNMNYFDYYIKKNICFKECYVAFKKLTADVDRESGFIIKLDENMVMIISHYKMANSILKTKSMVWRNIILKGKRELENDKGRTSL